MTEVKIFSYNTPEYHRALALRDKVLRQPLGLKFTEAELKKDEHDTHMGLFEGEEVLACLTLTRCENNRMKVRQVATAEHAQGKGLGRQLSEAAEKYCLDNGYNTVFCHARKVAAPFYEKLGYSILGHEFTEVGIPHYVMEKKLK